MSSQLINPSVTPLKDPAVIEALQTKILERLNPEQKEAASQSLDTGVKVLAGAGTGKTELISVRFLYLLQELEKCNTPRSSERLLVLTFTEETARSMKKKIGEKLEQFELAGLGADAWVSTFHTFANRVVRNHAYWLNRTRDFDIVDSLSQQVLFMRLTQKIRAGEFIDISRQLEQAGLTDIPANIFNAEGLLWLQTEAGLDRLNDLLDPTAIAKLLGHIKSAGFSPEAFYEESLASVDRLTQAFANLPCEYNPDLKKDENAGNYILQWEAALKGWMDPTWQPEITEGATAAKILDAMKFLKTAYVDTGKGSKYEPAYFEAQPLYDQQAYAKHCTQILAAIYALYQDELQCQNLCDFDDLINLAIKLFKENPQIRKQYQQQFKHIIVDEFQDSNGSQLELLKLLLDDERSNITVVGDIKQSIYGFRYAQPENMDLIFKTKNGERDYKQISLPTNYRSTGAILKTANRITSEITPDESQHLYPATDHQEQPDEERTNGLSPDVEWITFGQEVENSRGKPDTEKVDLQRDRELVFLAHKITELHRQHNYKFSDMAILVKNHKKANAIQSLFNDCGIPSLLQKNKSFFKTAPIKTAIAYLELMKNLRNETALVRILEQKLSQRQLAKLAWKRVALSEPEEKVTMIEVLQHLNNYQVELGFDDDLTIALQKLTEALVVLKKRQPRMTPLQLFLVISDQIGFVSPHAPLWKKVQERQQLKTFERLLFYLCGQTERSTITPTLDEVLDVLRQYQDDNSLELPLDELGDEENAVKIMTFHASKGLDFPVVFVAGVEGKPPPSTSEAALKFEPQYEGLNQYGLFVTKWQGKNTLAKDLHYLTWEKPRAEAEKKRLFYVALTRAKQKMFVLTSHSASKDWLKGDFYQHDQLTHWDEKKEEDFSFLEKNYWNKLLPNLEQQYIVETYCSNHDQECSPQKDTLQSNHSEAHEERIEHPMTLSFSALNTWQKCPVQYWFRYQWKLPEPLPPGEQQKTAIARGSGLHGLIQKHFIYKGNVDNSLARSILKSWFPETSENNLNDIVALYDTFCQSEYSYSALREAGYKILPEKRVRFPWQAIQSKESHNNHNVLIEIDGILDLLLYHPEKNYYRLIDFKTNKKLEKSDILNYAAQLKLYQKGIHYLHSETPLENNNVALAHLKPTCVETIPIPESSEITHLSEAITAIVEAASLEEGSLLPKAPDKPPCHHCPYRLICDQKT